METSVGTEQETMRRAGGSELRQRVQDVIRDLTLELHPRWDKTLSVRDGSDLDLDLGFDSLARAELLLRLNRAFEIDLPDALIVEAATAGEICDAVAGAVPAGRATPQTRAVQQIALPQSAEPLGTATLLEALAVHVRDHPDRPHIYLWREEQEEDCLTYGQLDQAARVAAFGLVQKGVEPGERVAIMLPTSLAFFQTFFGALMCGAVPVPIYPPLRRAQVEDHLRRQAAILRNAEAVRLITDDQTRAPGRLLEGLVPSLKGVHTVAELAASGAPLSRPVPAAPGDTALIQYTSGSTGDPKGVVLTHANLLANIRAMGRVLEASSSDVFASWLPLYHDMGLIGAWLGSLYYGAPAVIMSPLAFIAKPARWLWAIHDHKATLSAAPNFAFELCLKRIADADLEGLDLSCLRRVVNGAEPVSPSTVARFTERFQAYGFAPEALAPVYGLAECSVGLAFPPSGRKPIIDRVERRALGESGVARPADANDPNAVEIVACGQPLPGHQIRIVDTTGHEAPERTQGRLEFRGPSATKGYFQNPEKTQSLFHDSWLDTGDLAYVAEGDVYLTGRVKDIIIRAGRHIWPQELEDVVGALEAVRRGCVAAIAATDKASGTERLVVVAETRLTGAAERAELTRRILDATAEITEAPADEVVLAPPRAIPKTSSGKIRRGATRVLYETGALGRKDRAAWRQVSRLAISSAAGRLKRSLRTVGDYAYAGWWWSVLVLIAIGLWPLVVGLPRRVWRHAAVGAGIRLLFRLTGCPFAVERAGPVPARDVILVPNHTSYLDGGLISAAIEGPLAFVVAERFGRQLVAGRFLRALGTVFVGGGEPGLHEAEEAALAALKRGERLVIFPEGRLRRMPGLLSFYTGPFVLAGKAQVPIVPLTMTGARSLLRDGGQWFPRRGCLGVRIGPPVRTTGGDFEAALRLSEAVRTEMLAHCREPDLGRERIEFGRLENP
jgi:1-acyl-sn-glycerol-3-phosphate acyltransferase